MTKKTTKLKLPTGPRIFIYDVETTDLAADRGHILCAAGKWFGEDTVFKWRIDSGPGYAATPKSFRDDSGIVEGLTPYLEAADCAVAYFGKRFDAPYITTRALVHGMLPPAPYTIVDPWETAKRYLKLSNNRMATVADVLQLDKRKTHCSRETWALAQYGDRGSISKLLEYNVNDVLVLESVYKTLRPIIRAHPYVGAWQTSLPGSISAHRCPACGSSTSRSKGVRYTRTFEVQRRICCKCSHSFEGGRRKIS